MCVNCCGAASVLRIQTLPACLPAALQAAEDKAKWAYQHTKGEGLSLWPEVHANTSMHAWRGNPPGPAVRMGPGGQRWAGLADITVQPLALAARAACAGRISLLLFLAFMWDKGSNRQWPKRLTVHMPKGHALTGHALGALCQYIQCLEFKSF